MLHGVVVEPDEWIAAERDEAVVGHGIDQVRGDAIHVPIVVARLLHLQPNVGDLASNCRRADRKVAGVDRPIRPAAGAQHLPLQDVSLKVEQQENRVTAAAQVVASGGDGPSDEPTRNGRARTTEARLPARACRAIDPSGPGRIALPRRVAWATTVRCVCSANDVVA